MAADLASFRTRFPEFGDIVEYPDARVQLFLDDAIDIYIGSDENRWQGKYNYAHSYLAAHLLVKAESTELGDYSASSGAITSKSAGGVSVSRAVVAKSRSEQDDWYMSSSYGQVYISIRNTCFVGVLVTNGC